jgi:membrane protease subunit HflC
MNRLVSAGVLVLIALYLLTSSVFVVNQRQYAIVFALGEVKQVISEPGLHFKMPQPFQNVLFLDKRILTLDTPDADRFITAEKKNILVDAFVKWRIIAPTLYFVSFGGDERRALDRMAQIVKAALNEEITKRTVREVISGQRGSVMDAIQKKVADEAKDIGVEIVDVRLKRVDYVEQINLSVYQRMKAERTRVANELRSTGAAESEKIRADADRQVTVLLADAYRDAEMLRGEGDAKASQIYAGAFGKSPEFYKFYRSLEAYRWWLIQVPSSSSISRIRAQLPPARRNNIAGRADCSVFCDRLMSFLLKAPSLLLSCWLVQPQSLLRRSVACGDAATCSIFYPYCSCHAQLATPRKYC